MKFKFADYLKSKMNDSSKEDFSMIQREEKERMIGTPTLRLIDKDGNLIDEYTDHNLIVRMGRNQIIRFLANMVTAGITSCAVGTGGVNISDAFSPISPNETDIALVAEVPLSRKGIDSVALGDGATPTSLTFTTLFTSANVNAIVSEAGLFFNNGSLFARYTFPSMYLRSDKGYSLEISWVIQF